MNRTPYVGAKVRYTMVRKMCTSVDATVIEVLSETQVRLSIVGKKNQHPNGPVCYGTRMGEWSWPE